MTQRVVLVDGDVYAYQAAAACERAINWGDGTDDDSCLWTLHAEAEDATLTVDASIADLTTSTGADRVIVALSDKDNWRKDVLPTYKSNRANVRRPLVLPVVRQYLRDNYEVWERPGLEGDDILGILATLKTVVPGEKVVASIDKDLSTIPGFHYRTHKRELGIFEVTREEADRWHILQSIAGDITDGYTGCPGMGMKAAEEFLNEPYMLVPQPYTISRGKNKGEEGVKWVKESTPHLWDAIVSLFAKAGYNEAYALQQFRVARILRATDYDFQKKAPILWTPDLLPLM